MIFPDTKLKLACPKSLAVKMLHFSSDKEKQLMLREACVAYKIGRAMASLAPRVYDVKVIKNNLFILMDAGSITLWDMIRAHGSWTTMAPLTLALSTALFHQVLRGLL